MIPGVPYDAEIEYLESTGTQWIDTGVTLTSSDIVHCDFMLTNGTYSAIFGAGNADGAAGASYSIYLQNRATLQFQCTSAPGATASYAINARYSFVGDISGRTMSLNGGTAISAGNTPLISMAQSVYIFCRNLNGVADRKCRMRLYAFSIVGRCDFIPVRVGQTGYMYDRVTKRLFGNKGTGSFVLGPDAAKPVMGLWGMRKVYTADDYIKDGLVALWDGIENAGRGQWGKNNPNATDWPALVGGNTWGTGTNIKYNSEKHYYDTNRVGNSDALKFNLPKAVNLRGSTFEFVVEGNYASADYRFLIGLNSQASDGDFFQIGVSQVRMHYRASSLYATGALNTPYTFSASSSASGSARLYRNSVMVQSPSAADFNVTNFRCPANSANHISGKLWAIRVYNRDLSPAEIAHNYQIDKARFNLP